MSSRGWMSGAQKQTQGCIRAECAQGTQEEQEDKGLKVGL